MHYINFHIFLSCSSQYYKTCAFNQLILLHTLYEYLKPATAGTAYYVLPLDTNYYTITCPNSHTTRHVPLSAWRRLASCIYSSRINTYTLAAFSDYEKNSSHVLLFHQYDRILPCLSFAMRIARVFPLLLHQVVQYQYVHSATLLMQYRFQTVNQQLHAPRRQALLRLLRLRSTNTIVVLLVEWVSHMAVPAGATVPI